MTVCIAAICQNIEPHIVFCVDMKGSMEWTSSETARKFRRIGRQYWALLAGPLSEAEELSAEIGFALRAHEPNHVPDLLRLVRASVGRRRLEFAEDHLQTTLAIPYADFRKRGKKDLPEELYAQVFREIKEHRSSVELIVLGFLKGGAGPVLIKVSWEKVWRCPDFAVAGSGTQLAEASLFQREQSIFNTLPSTIYQVYEAKRLAEKASDVGKLLVMMVLKDGKAPQLLTEDGVNALSDRFVRFGVRAVESQEFPTNAFRELPLGRRTV